MTIAEAIEQAQKIGGPAVLKRIDNSGLRLRLQENGYIDFPQHIILHAGYLCDDQWEVDYAMKFYTYDVLDALRPLHSDISNLKVPEWNDWCKEKSIEIVRAVARALHVHIEVSKPITDEDLP